MLLRVALCASHDQQQRNHGSDFYDLTMYTLAVPSRKLTRRGGAGVVRQSVAARE